MLSAILNILSKHYSLIHYIILLWIEEDPRVLPSSREGLSFDDVIQFMWSGLRGFDQRLNDAAGFEVEASIIGTGVSITAVLGWVDVYDCVRRSDRRFDVDYRSCSY